MTVYVDSSIVLRRLRKEAAPLPTWGEWERAYASVLLRVETFRTLDRIRLSGRVDDEEVATLVASAQLMLAAISLVSLSDVILERAAQSFLTPIGTLDGLHLATALRLREQGVIDGPFLTHDSGLAVAARSLNFLVRGI